MAYKIGNRTIGFKDKPHIIGYASVVGKKEHEGPLSKEFDYYTMYGYKTFSLLFVSIIAIFEHMCYTFKVLLDIDRWR